MVGLMPDKLMWIGIGIFNDNVDANQADVKLSENHESLDAQFPGLHPHPRPLVEFKFLVKGPIWPPSSGRTVVDAPTTDAPQKAHRP